MLTGFLYNLPGLGAVWWVVGVYQGFLGYRFAGCVRICVCGVSVVVVTSSVSKNKLFIVYAWSSVIALFFLISAPHCQVCILVSIVHVGPDRVRDRSLQL